MFKLVYSRFLDRYRSLIDAPRPDLGCEFVADIAFLIDSSGSIRLEYLNQLQFVQYITTRFVLLFNGRLNKVLCHPGMNVAIVSPLIYIARPFYFHYQVSLKTQHLTTY